MPLQCDQNSLSNNNNGIKNKSCKINIKLKMIPAILIICCTIIFGHYEQDNDTSNGKEVIEWIVLEYDEASGKSAKVFTA